MKKFNTTILNKSLNNIFYLILVTHIFSNVSTYQDINIEWIRQFGSDNSEEFGSAITKDSDNYIYATGYRNLKCFLYKLDSEGNLIFSIFLDINSLCYSIKTYENKSIYIVGRTSQDFDNNINNGGTDIIVIKYDINGVKLWSKLIGTTSDENNPHIEIDKFSNSYITGATNGIFDPNFNNNNQISIFLLKLDSNGKTIWIKQTSSNNVSTYGQLSLTINLSNEIWISVGGFILIYDTNGNYLSRFETGLNGIEAILSDISSKSIYITGKNNNLGKTQIFLSKINENYQNIWTSSIDAYLHDGCQDLSIDNSGNIYITGYSNKNFDNIKEYSTYYNSFLIVFNSNGERLITKMFGGDKSDSSHGVIVDSIGNVYIVGYTYNILQEGYISSYFPDTFIVKFSSCPKSCKKCPEKSSLCQECADNYYIKSNTQFPTFCFLKSPIGYYFDYSTSSFNICDISCKSCIENFKNCQECAQDYFPIINMKFPTFCHKLPFNEYFLDSSTSSLKPCDQSCKSCDNNPTNCTECKDNYTPYYKNFPSFCVYTNIPNCMIKGDLGCLSCEDGFYLESNTICKKCSDNCVKCNSLKDCYLCHQGFFPKLNIDQNIIICVEDTLCKDFDNYLRKCKLCKDGYYLNNSVCTSCKEINEYCSTCNNEGICTSCISNNYMLFNDKCKCITNCKSCKEYCINCDDGTCLDIKCPLNCKRCSRESTCDECIEGFIINSDNICEFNSSCKRIENNTCLECNGGYELISGQCLCKNGVIDNISKYCCNKIDNCKNENLLYYQHLNRCGCSKCETNFSFNRICYETPDNNCYIFNKDKNIFIEINQSSCLLSRSEFVILYKNSCINEEYSNLMTYRPKDKKYFTFMLDHRLNYHYLGYKYIPEIRNTQYCNENINYYLYFDYNCNINVSDEFIEFLNKLSNLIISYEENNNGKIEKLNFISDLIEEYTNQCGKAFYFTDKEYLRDYCIISKNTKVDIANRMCESGRVCLISKMYSFDFDENDKPSTKCFDCGYSDYHYDKDNKVCFSSIFYDSYLKRNIMLIFFIAAGLLIIFEIIIALLMIKKFKNDEMKRASSKEWMISIYSIIDLLLDLGFLFGASYPNIITKYINIGIICTQPIILLIIGAVLFLKNKSLIDCYNNLLVKIIFFLPFSFIFMILSMFNLFGNKYDPLKFNNFLKQTLCYDLDNETRRKFCKLAIKTIDYMFESIPEFTLKIYLLFFTKNREFFIIASCLISFLGLIFSSYFLWSEWNEYKINRNIEENFNTNAAKKANEAINICINNEVNYIKDVDKKEEINKEICGIVETNLKNECKENNQDLERIVNYREVNIKNSSNYQETLNDIK